MAQNKDKYDGSREEWCFVLFSELTLENCIDYKAIKSDYKTRIRSLVLNSLITLKKRLIIQCGSS